MVQRRLGKMLGLNYLKLKFILKYSVQINTVPLTSKLPPSRATQITSRATRITSRTMKKQLKVL